MDTSTKRLEAVLANIEQVCLKLGRSKDSVQLIAVSKTFGPEDIEPLLEAGWRHFGENRVQEAQSKWPPLKERYSDLVLHLIGPLQSNKAADAVALFDVIQTVDRPKIAKALAQEIRKQQKAPKLLVQVNTGSEDQKAGIQPKETEAFIKKCRETHCLEISGLMAIPPIDDNPGPHFGLLRKLALENNVKGLSMGMSADYETAIEFGGTYVRVGSGIFGERTRGAWKPE